MRCSNYIWVINSFIAYQGAAYIRGMTVLKIFVRIFVKLCDFGQLLLNFFMTVFCRLKQELK